MQLLLMRRSATSGEGDWTGPDRSGIVVCADTGQRNKVGTLFLGTIWAGPFDSLGNKKWSHDESECIFVNVSADARRKKQDGGGSEMEREKQPVLQTRGWIPSHGANRTTFPFLSGWRR